MLTEEVRMRRESKQWQEEGSQCCSSRKMSVSTLPELTAGFIAYPAAAALISSTRVLGHIDTRERLPPPQ
jgi:hypothetical protein